MMPKRIQRKRTKGWKMPENAIYVGRPGRWGNPFKPGDLDLDGSRMNLTVALNRYRARIAWMRDHEELNLAELQGKDLACWCPLDQPCHADVLLELANDDV